MIKPLKRLYKKHIKETKMKKGAVKRLFFECLCVFVVISIPIAVKSYDLMGLAIVTTLGYVSTIVDYFYFPYLKENFKTLEKCGFQRSYVWSIMFLNLVLTNFLVAAIYHECELDGFQWYVPLQIIVNMALTELLFTSAHMMLHYTLRGAKIHLMHHCCKQASWSTNLIFNPFDMAIEFSGPVLGILAMHFYVWKNENTMILSTLLLHLWYALDHSATLKLPHTKHHAHVNTMFTIYLKRHFTFKKPELVKKLLKQVS